MARGDNPESGVTGARVNLDPESGVTSAKVGIVTATDIDIDIEHTLCPAKDASPADALPKPCDSQTIVKAD